MLALDSESQHLRMLYQDPTILDDVSAVLLPVNPIFLSEIDFDVQDCDVCCEGARSINAQHHIFVAKQLVVAGLGFCFASRPQNGSAESKNNPSCQLIRHSLTPWSGSSRPKTSSLMLDDSLYT